MANKPCKHCEKEGHTAFYCPFKPRTQLKKTKLRQRGKQAKNWSYTRSKWLEANPPDFSGYWYCYICKKPLTIETLTVDHVLPRGSNPHLRYDLNNLRPACYLCNSKKGSKKLDQM